MARLLEPRDLAGTARQRTRQHPTLTRGAAIEHQAQWLPTHAGTQVIPDCGHWVQQERPEEVNALLLDFLKQVSP